MPLLLLVLLILPTTAICILIWDKFPNLTFTLYSTPSSSRVDVNIAQCLALSSFCNTMQNDLSVSFRN